MMIHAVWLQPKPDTTEEELQAVLERVKELKDLIPGIVDIQVGKNVNQFNQGYTHGFLMRFVNQEALSAYSPHPAHKAVSPELRRLCTTLLNFDFPEIESLLLDA